MYMQIEKTTRNKPNEEACTGCTSHVCQSWRLARTPRPCGSGLTSISSSSTSSARSAVAPAATRAWRAIARAIIRAGTAGESCSRWVGTAGVSQQQPTPCRGQAATKSFFGACSKQYLLLSCTTYGPPLLPLLSLLTLGRSVCGRHGSLDPKSNEPCGAAGQI